MNRTLLTILFVAVTGILSATAQVTGKWKTIDDETGQAKSIVEIYEQDGKVYGKIVDILNPAKKNAKCDRCKGADKGKPLLGLVIIKNLVKDGDEWTDGDILDPTKGKEYKLLLSGTPLVNK
ncbi:MAG: DUF2147 domain-containing protein, partial [Bacteroidota bacterium]